MVIDKIKPLLKLLRIRQYYKNALIFVAIFFSEKIFEFALYPNIFLGFILLCCASSINYIINDIKDIEKDRIHQEKQKKKPLASGELSVSFAIVLLLTLIGVIVISLLFLIQNDYKLFTTLIIILLIITGQLYNLVLKNYPFMDMITLSFGYIWRTLAGCVFIGYLISPWLFLAIFEVAMFLVIAKRRGDLIYLGKEKASEHKKVYNQYSEELLVQLHGMIATALFITFSLYLINKFNLNLYGEPGNITPVHHYIVILSIPFALFIIMRFMYLTSVKPEVARHAEKIFFDKGILIAGAITGAILAYSFYFDTLITLLFP